MNQEIFTPGFRDTLKSLGYSVPDLVADLDDLSGSADTRRLLREWTGLPNDVIGEGLFNDERDVIAPCIYAVLLKELDPWIKVNATDGLPELSVKQVSRVTQMSPQKIVSVLGLYPLLFDINGIQYTSSVQKPEFPAGDNLRLKDSHRFDVSASRVSREARYQSRKPGGIQVQKSGLQNSRINSVIRKKAWENLEIRFIPCDFDENSVNYGVMSDLEIDSKNAEQSSIDSVYTQENAQDILDVYRWFQDIGFGKNWLYKQKDALFVQSLIRLSRGEPVDFLIWNCIGFQWFADPKGAMPTCNITNNLDAAITPFFQNKIYDIETVLSTLGKPRITILAPSNEALDTSGVWRYEQSEGERKIILNETVTGLQRIFCSRLNTNIQVMSWQEYLLSRGARYDSQYYSKQGEYRLRSSKKFNKIIKEAVKSGQGYFAQNKITNIQNTMLRDREIAYYGVYAGEGVAFEELQKRGQGIVIVNFEEFRVPQMEFLGANGNLSILTPIKENEMLSYYRWEARQVANRSL